MKELLKTQKLSVSVIGYLAILLLGFLSIQKPDYSLKLTTNQMVEEIENLNFEVYPEDVDALVYSEDKSYAFVDLRNTFEYEKDHIDGAINIPSLELFEKENISHIEDLQKDSTIIVFYGANQLEANGPWMVLYQMGFSNTKVLLGGFFAYSKLVYDYEEVNYFAEEPHFDFVTIMSNSEPSDLYNETSEPEIIIPVRRVKNNIEEGGC